MLALLKVPTMSTPKPARLAESFTVIRADLLAPKLREILETLDYLATSQKINRGTCTPLDSARDDLHDLLCEVSS